MKRVNCTLNFPNGNEIHLIKEVKSLDALLTYLKARFPGASSYVLTWSVSI